MQLKSTKCGLQRTPRIASVQWKEWMLVSLSLVYWFFYYLRSDSQQTTNNARYDAICVQECPNFNIWGYGLRSKRFEGSRVYLSNRPHFLWVYRRDNPRGMLGEHEKSL